MTVSRLRDIPGIGVDRMGDAADAARDPDMLRLENLDTDIPPPQAAIDATRAAASRDDANSYLPFLGTDALRQAVVARLEADTGITYDWRAQCVISAGGLSGILNALLAMLEPGDEVIISDPGLRRAYQPHPTRGRGDAVHAAAVWWTVAGGWTWRRWPRPRAGGPGRCSP